MACAAIPDLQQNANAFPSPTGLIVPLYSYPDVTWDELVQEKNTHSTVPIIAIINPDNGPGEKDSNYVAGVQKLQSAGITVLGYVYTTYGARNATSVEDDINSYSNWYHVNGIFFDEMSYVTGNESYYKNLSDYTKSLGLTLTIGNPGIDTSPSYIGTVDNLVIYDNPGLPPVSSFEGWHKNYSKTDFSIISYGINSINDTYVANAARYVQYLYISNSTLPNPFNTLPVYLDSLLGILGNIEDQNYGSNPMKVKSSSYGQPEVGTIEIDLMSVSGERADYHGISLKIYQDNANSVFKTLTSLSGNPYNISLPLGHRYKIEVYASSMLASVGYVDLESSNKQLTVDIPNPGSIRFIVLYNDGNTPIDNATVLVKSTDGTYGYWTNSTTDNTGTTIRFWLQPTISNDNYYAAYVLINNDLSYSYSPIDVLPGLSSDLKIITPWPAELPPITASVYKSNFQKVTKSDGSFVVQLYDHEGNKIAESNVNAIGEASFVNLKVGSYIFHVIDLNNENNDEWNATQMILDGNKTTVQIFKNTNHTTQASMNVSSNTTVSQNQIPVWIRNNVKWWAQNQVSDSNFISGMQYLIDEGVMKAPQTNTTDSPQSIPAWIKSSASWWYQGQISDEDFINGMQYLISNGIVKMHYDTTPL